MDISSGTMRFQNGNTIITGGRGNITFSSFSAPAFEPYPTSFYEEAMEQAKHLLDIMDLYDATDMNIASQHITRTITGSLARITYDVSHSCNELQINLTHLETNKQHAYRILRTPQNAKREYTAHFYLEKLLEEILQLQKKTKSLPDGISNSFYFLHDKEMEHANLALPHSFKEYLKQTRTYPKLRHHLGQHFVSAKPPAISL